MPIEIEGLFLHTDWSFFPAKIAVKPVAGRKYTSGYLMEVNRFEKSARS